MANRSSRIKRCGCQSKGVAKGVMSASEYQDQEYGKGMRVHTVKRDGSHNCTVCGGNK